jgi:hypothetical protein
MPYTGGYEGTMKMTGMRPGELPEQPYAIYGRAETSSTLGEVRRTPRLEQTIHRVQGMRERLIAIGIDLTDATDMVVGNTGPQNSRAAPAEHGANGLIDILNHNLDLLERDIAVIGDTVERLREGL